MSCILATVIHIRKLITFLFCKEIKKMPAGSFHIEPADPMVIVNSSAKKASNEGGGG